MTAIKLKIKYSIKSEVEQILYIAPKIPWFQKMGYKIALLKDTKIIDSETTKSEAKKLVTKEYRKDDYKGAAKLIQKRWKQFSPDFTKKLLNFGFRPKSYYFLFLTKYGTGGGYWLPNKITINFKYKAANFTILVIMHEITHLLIEPLIQKYKIDHWTKERIVDLILSKIAPKFNKMQNLPNKNRKIIDKMFEKFFPDMDQLLKNISSQPKK